MKKALGWLMSAAFILVVLAIAMRVGPIRRIVTGSAA